MSASSTVGSRSEFPAVIATGTPVAIVSLPVASSHGAFWKRRDLTTE